MLISKILHTAGYKVDTAFSAYEAFEKIYIKTYDMVLLEGNIPDKDSYELCRQLKKTMQDNTDSAPILFISDSNDIQKKIAGFECGGDDYIIKPIVKEELLARIRVLIRNLDLQKELHETHKKLEKELKLVGEIQRSFLPSEFPYHPKLRLSACYQPSMQAGGDYYDVIPIDENHWGIVMADIAGHGVSAAVVMALTQWTVKEFSLGITSPCNALTTFNQVLARHLTSDHFVTMFYAALNLQTMKMTYASAGHGSMLHYSSNKKDVFQLKTENGFPLKSIEGDQYDEKSMVLSSGDKLIFFTDGVTEVMNSEQILYGQERLISLLHKHHDLPPEELVNKILTDSERFRGNYKRYDDFTLMAIEYL